MKHDAFKMEFTPDELLYLLFKKKICPRCGGRMEKVKEYETRLGSEFKSSHGFFFADTARVKYYIYYFTCQECGAKYPLSELAKQKE